VLFILCFAAWSFTVGAMISVFFGQHFKVGATGWDYCRVFAAGALVTVLIIASFNFKKRSVLMLITGLVLGLAQAGFAFSTSFPLSLLMMIFAAQVPWARSRWRWYIADLPDPAQRGRVLSVLLLASALAPDELWQRFVVSHRYSMDDRRNITGAGRRHDPDLVPGAGNAQNGLKQPLWDFTGYQTICLLFRRLSRIVLPVCLQYISAPAPAYPILMVICIQECPRYAHYPVLQCPSNSFCAFGSQSNSVTFSPFREICRWRQKR